MFGPELQQIFAQLMQQNLAGMQGKQAPPQARFTGPLGHYGLLAQNLAGGAQQGFLPQPQSRPIDNLPPSINPTIPNQNKRRGIPGLPPGLLGGFY